MGRATRIVHDAARAFAPDSRDMTSRGMRECELEIAQFGRQPPAIHLRQ